MNDTTQTCDQLLGEYCGFRSDIIIARSCLERRLDLSPEEQVALAARHLDAALLRTATRVAPYRLIDLRDGRVWDFQHAEDVTDMMFVLTMWPPRPAVYKHGRRFPGRLAGDVQELAQKLEAF